MNYEGMIFVPSEPVPELKPSQEQIKRIARSLYPIVLEYYNIQEDKKEDNNKESSSRIRGAEHDKRTRDADST